MIANLKTGLIVSGILMCAVGVVALSPFLLGFALLGKAMQIVGRVVG